MEQNSDLTLFIPITISFIMLGLGLSLGIEDFKRIILHPRAIIIGLMCQMVLLPAICFAICIVFLLPPALAVGLMLLAASPNGATANFYSHLAKGDVALSISLTAVNNIITLFTLPLVVNFAIDYFMQGTWAVPIQFKKVLEVFLLVLIPVAVGMATNYFLPQHSKNYSNR